MPYNSIPCNLEALSENYLPEEISIREKQKQKIIQYIRAAELGASFALILCGESGTGKTSIVKFLINKSICSGIRIKSIYINCAEKDTLNSVLNELLRKLNTYHIPQECNSKISKLKELLRKKRAVIILDEIDRLANKEKLLNNFPEVSTGLILITNNKSELFKKDKRLLSRISGETILFNEYTPEEILLILKARIKAALIERRIPVTILRRISKKCKGDARLAINTMKIIAIKIISQPSDFNPETIEEIIENTTTHRIEHRLQNLTMHHRLIYIIIKGHPDIISSKLLKRYNNRIKMRKIIPVAGRTFIKYVNRLISEGLVISEKTTKGTNRSFRCA